MRTLNDPTILKSQAYLNGVFIGGADAEVTNPSSGDVLAKVPMFGEAEATAAVEAAAGAFRSWADKTAKERSAVLRKWFDLIIATSTTSPLS